MSNDYLYKVILGSIVSEKSTRIAEKDKQFVFRIDPKATKEEVKASIELLFKVKVKSVQVLNIKVITKLRGRVVGKRNDIRKAYVCLADGQDINFAEVK